MSRLFSPTQSSRMRDLKSTAGAAAPPRPRQKQRKGRTKSLQAASRSPSRLPPGSPVFTLNMSHHSSDVQPFCSDDDDAAASAGVAHAMSDTDTGSSDDVSRWAYGPDSNLYSDSEGTTLPPRSSTAPSAAAESGNIEWDEASELPRGGVERWDDAEGVWRRRWATPG